MSREPRRGTRDRPRVVFVVSALDAVGGIPSYARAVIAAMERVADVEVVDLSLSGSLVDQGRGFVRAMAQIIRIRPDLVVLSHVGLGPIGVAWQRLRGRFAVLAYGIEIWVTPTPRLRRTLSAANLVWPISTFTRAEVARVAPDARLGPVLGGAIDEAYFQAHEATDGPFRVLFVATLADLRAKGADTLIEAGQRLARDHELELRVVGSGRASDELAAYVDAHDGHGIVRMVGRVDHDGLLEEYRRADALVLLTRFERGARPRGEGLGLVLLEAQAAETPVIGSAQGGSIDTIRPGETGHLLSPEDVDSLERHLRAWIDDPETAREMGRRGRAFVEREHSFDAFAGRIRDALRRSFEDT